MARSSRNYFTKETEEYIIKYNSSTDPEEKQQIFTEHLYYPFYKLAECIIHTFKFYHTDVSNLEDLKCDIVRVIWEEKIGGFNPGFGTKAFSYFGTIIKRWLMSYDTRNYLLKKKILTLEARPSVDSLEELQLDDYLDLERPEVLTLSEIMDGWVQTTDEQLQDLFPDESERRIADAVLTLFRTRQSLEVFNKKALYIYLKEITGSKTVYISRVVAKLKESFYTNLKYFQDHDLISNNLN